MSEPSWTPEPEHDRTIEENWLFTLRREGFRSRESGRTHGFYVIHVADAVSVIAVTPDRRVLMVRQFRAGSRGDSLEFPGGLIDSGEDATTAAVRELLEETGYAGDPPVILNAVWANPSILSSRITTVLVENARPVAETSFDEHEELSVELVPEGDLPAMVVDGRIDHALVVLGLLVWQTRRDAPSP